MLKQLERLQQVAADHPGAAQITANCTSVLRGATGKRAGNYIEATAPEERTLLAATGMAAVISSDKFDGLITEGTDSQLGGWIDQLADKGLMSKLKGALMKTGEISATHYYFPLARDVGVTAMRLYGAVRGRDVSAGNVGKYKTLVDGGLAIVACSPVAQNADLVRSLASTGTALSLLSIPGYISPYLKSKKELPEGSEVTTRNGVFRQAVARPMGKLVELIDEKAPNVTPTHVTKIAKGMVFTSGILAVTDPKHAKLWTAIFTVGSLGDGADGGLDRKKRANDPEYAPDPDEGMLADVESDRQQEILILSILSLIAARHGNRVAAAHYGIATALAATTSYTRAAAEIKGSVVPEDGTGTRISNAIMAGAGICFNEHSDASDTISAGLAAGKVITTLERIDVIRKGEESKHCEGTKNDPEFRRQATVRKKVLKRYVIGGAVVGTVLTANAIFGMNGQKATSRAPVRK